MFLAYSASKPIVWIYVLCTINGALLMALMVLLMIVEVVLVMLEVKM